MTDDVPEAAGQYLAGDRLLAFWRNVPQRESADACWLWVGGHNGAGYGHFRVGGKHELAHRVSWKDHGYALAKRVVLRHRCDTPRCVNPRHLMVGTQRDNIHDCVLRGRHRTPFRRAESAAIDG